jgi:hypothetical protein
MVDERVGTWQHLNTKLREDNADASERKKVNAMSSQRVSAPIARWHSP